MLQDEAQIWVCSTNQTFTKVSRWYEARPIYCELSGVRGTEVPANKDHAASSVPVEMPSEREPQLSVAVPLLAKSVYKKSGRYLESKKQAAPTASHHHLGQ